VQEHLQYLDEHYSCYDDGEGRLWVVSPFAFADRDLIEVSVREISGCRFRVSDLGETLRHLAAIGFDAFSDENAEALISEISNQHQVHVDEGVISKVSTADSLGGAIHEVISACVATSNLTHLMRESRLRMAADRNALFKVELSKFLSELHLPLTRPRLVKGSSGQRFKLDFVIEGSMVAYIKGLSPAKATYTRQTVDRLFREWSELRNGQWQATVLDDRVVKWVTPDVVTLQKVSDVFFWTERGAFQEVLVSRFKEDIERVR